MYTWSFDYFYPIVLSLSILLSPFVGYYVFKKIFKNRNKLFILLFNFVFLVILLVFFTYMKEIHTDIIENLCFDLPYGSYKNESIPQGCYEYKKDYGIGWPLKVMFSMLYGFVYLIMINIFWLIYEKFKHIKNK